MGWASGSDIANRMIAGISKEVADSVIRQKLYAIMISALESGDWDTQDECYGQDPAFDAALREAHPDWKLI